MDGVILILTLVIIGVGEIHIIQTDGVGVILIVMDHIGAITHGVTHITVMVQEDMVMRTFHVLHILQYVLPIEDYMTRVRVADQQTVEVTVQYHAV